MNAAARKLTDADNVSISPVPAIDVFRERCEARAILVEACLLDLHEAVDVLQAEAERTGLVDDIGQDAVQRMMADALPLCRERANSRPTSRRLPIA